METVVAAAAADHHLKGGMPTLLAASFAYWNPWIIVSLQQQGWGG